MDGILSLIGKIILGLIGLGIVVFAHETGHFIAARLVGIDVEAFSIGWGKAILKKKIGPVEYRLGLFPIGGYCKMSGENEFQTAWENRAKEIKPVKGTYYGASPWRRIIVCIAGPLFNLLFAVIIFSIIWGIGFEVNTLDNRIVLASDIDQDSHYPANEAGLVTGDRIIRIDGQNVENYHDVQRLISRNAQKNLSFIVQRDGRELELNVRPSLDKATGAGKIGVYFWTEPLISAVTENTPAFYAGLAAGDRITSINGENFPYAAALYRILKDSPSILNIEFERSGTVLHTELVLNYTDAGIGDTGISYETIRYRTPRLSPPEAVIKGIAETWDTFTVSLQSLVLLFKGVDLTQAVSGPVRITYMVGEVATEGFGQEI